MNFQFFREIDRPMHFKAIDYQKVIKIGWLTVRSEPIFFNDAANIDGDSRFTKYQIVSSVQGNRFRKKGPFP